MDARGLLGHVELLADLAVGGAARDQLEHLALALGEAERVVGLTRLVAVRQSGLLTVDP